MTWPVCEIRDLRVTIGRVPERFDLYVPAFDLAVGDAVALIAPSGSGKSLFVETLALVRQPLAMSWFVFGKAADRAFDARKAWASGREDHLSAFRRRHIGFLLQSGGLFKSLTVEANVRLPAQLAETDVDFPMTLLDHVGIAGLRRRRPRTLSGGERQRAALVRAMATRPTLLIADEPTASLDTTNAKQAMSLIREFVERGIVKAACIVTHDDALAEMAGFECLSIAVAPSSAGATATLQERRLSAA